MGVLIHVGCSGLKASRTQAHGMMDKMFEATDLLDCLKRNTSGGNNRLAARLAREPMKYMVLTEDEMASPSYTWVFLAPLIRTPSLDEIAPI